jgi:hypothetical protein
MDWAPPYDWAGGGNRRKSMATRFWGAKSFHANGPFRAVPRRQGMGRERGLLSEVVAL